MKKSTIVLISSILILSLLVISGCYIDRNGGSISSPDGQAADDIVTSPGLGPQYRANVHQEGVENPWLPIQTTEVVLGDSTDAVRVSYRDYVETKARQSRNNIFCIYLPNVDVNMNLEAMSVSLKAVNLAAGITVTQGEEWHGADPARQSKVVLEIEISQQVEPGEYKIEVSVGIDGKDYGQVPCTIRVM
jgi:hypothetical protein